MTVEEFRAAGAALFGPGWQSRMARRLGVNPRTVRRWASGEVPVPDYVEAALMGLQREAADLPTFVIGEDPETEQEYIVRLIYPRFVAKIRPDDELASGLAYAVGDDQLCEFVWSDPMPTGDALTTLLESAADALELLSDRAESP